MHAAKTLGRKLGFYGQLHYYIITSIFRFVKDGVLMILALLMRRGFRIAPVAGNLSLID